MTYIKLNGGACSDCIQAIANDDYSGIDDATEALVRRGIERIGQHLIVGEEQGFSWMPCAVCGGLAGDRHEVGYLTESSETPPATLTKQEAFFWTNAGF